MNKIMSVLIILAGVSLLLTCDISSAFIDEIQNKLASDSQESGTNPPDEIKIVGVLDTSFNSKGYVVHDNAAGGSADDQGQGIAIDSSGRILVAGYSSNGLNDDMAIWRYNTNGTLDTTFNAQGYVVHNSAAGGNDYDYGTGIAVDSSGKILVAGKSSNGSNYDMVIWRYNSDGTMDTGFNSTGYVVHDNAAGGSGDDSGVGIAVDSSGRILVAGESSNGSNTDMVIWRYNSDGTMDTGFNSTGYVVHDSAAGASGDDSGYGIAVDSSGRILVAGYSYNTTNNMDMVIWRYNTNGTLDTTFYWQGYVVHDGAAGENSFDMGVGIAIDSSGRILVAGGSYNITTTTSDMATWRYNSDGTMDTGFNSTGYVVHDNAAGGSGDDSGYGIAIDSSGRILVAGESSNGSNTDMVIWRYNNDGTLDTTFNSQGNNPGCVVHDSAAGASGDDSGYGIAVDSSGRILVAGYSYNGSNYDMTIWRYK